jgi:hypothetical protein
MLAKFSHCVVILLAMGLGVGPSSIAAQAGSSTQFSGDATALSATVLGTSVTVAHAGPLPSSGGAQEASLLKASEPGLLTAEVLHASTVGQGDRSRSEASVADLSLTVAGNTVTADFLMSRAMAVCGSGGATTSGSSELAGLTINGQRITVGAPPNQTVDLPDGSKVIINEQSTSPGSMTVNALHVIVPGVADVVVASAHADITCPPPGQVSCTGGDFVTGGGWIEPAGSRDNFAVAGGIKNGSNWGHLEYHDHAANGPSVHGTGVTLYTPTGLNSRHIEGTAEVNGQPGYTYAVDVTDNGSPGHNDLFRLQLSNGYTTGQTASNLGGGNIQLHKPCA